MNDMPSTQRKSRAAAPAGNEREILERTQSIDCEQQLISGVVFDETGEAWAIAVQCGVKAAAFFHPQNRIIWETVASLHARGAPCNAGVLAEEIRAAGRLEDIGGIAYYAIATGHIVLTASVRYYAEQIVMLWQLRHTITLAAELRESVAGFSTREDFAKAAGEIGQRLIRFGCKTAPRTIAEQVASVRDDVLARAEGKQDKSGWVYTGMARFDSKLLPFGCTREDQFIIAAGGSGHGKSALMRQIAGAALIDGKRVLVYTRETSIEGFIEQLAASWCQIDLRTIDRTPRDKLDDFSQKCAWLENEIADRRLFVVQHEAATPLLTVEDLSRHYRAFAHMHGHPDLVIVDYAQLFLTQKRCNSREQEVATVSHTLQSLCRESGKVWIVGAQYNESGLKEMRTVKRDENGNIIHRMPSAGDLRESQALYHDADRVICIYRPPEDGNRNDQTGPSVGSYPEQWLVQIKRRKGGLGYVRCIFEAPFTRFREIAREGDNIGAGVATAPAASSAAGKPAAAVPPGGMSKADFKKRIQN